MMKKGRDKMVRSGDFADKGTPAAEVWVCVSGCNVPGVGTWAGGEKITDPAIISKICGSPNFMKIEEVE